MDGMVILTTCLSTSRNVGDRVGSENAVLVESVFSLVFVCVEHKDRSWASGVSS